MLNTRRLLISAFVIVVVLVAGIIATENDGPGQPESGGTVTNSQTGGDVFGMSAPKFTLTNMEGDSVSLSDFEDKVVILNFWATWCAPCREEIPGFIELQESFQDDMVILGISVDQDAQRVVPPFVERFGVNYPVLYGTAEVMNDYGGIVGIPTSFVLDREHLIQRIYVGYRPLFVFERDVKKLTES